MLLDRLLDDDAAPIVIVSAPPGYGKTILLTQWAERSCRPFAWVSIDEHGNDPVVLLSYIAAALDRVSSLDPAVFEALTSTDTSIEATAVPRLTSALAAIESDFVLVLDDVQALSNPRSLDVIDALVGHVSGRSALALSGQIEPSRTVASLRVRGLSLELGPDDLRMGNEEAGELMRASGVELAEAELAELVDQAEGWPAGLYLATMAIRAGVKPTTFRGDDRFVADYLHSQLLDKAPERQRQFLTRTAVLERMSPALCDEVLSSRGSAQALEELERSNLFVVPLDHNREWYRYHRLFRELLRADLERSEPDLAPELLTRAANWCAENSQPDAAVRYAQSAGDTDLVVDLVIAHAQAQYREGRATTVEGWLRWLETQDAIEQRPIIAVLGAWFWAIRGKPDEAERWTDVAQRASLEEDARNENVAVEPWLAVLRAARCSHGVARMQADAQFAIDEFGRASRWWATAAILAGSSHRLGGDDDRAEDVFVDAVETAVATEGWGAASLGLAYRAMIACEGDDWARAGSLAGEALDIVHRSRMEEYPPNALVYAICARAAVHRREPGRATELLASANRLRPRLTHVLAAFSIPVRLELARTYLELADAAGARTLLREIDVMLRRGRDYGCLREQVEEVRSRLETVAVDVPGASTITTAELRLLPFLPTHLTFREIGERLYLSRHTVKSQAMSIYRKLDVTSRGEAVERARQLGLL